MESIRVTISTKRHKGLRLKRRYRLCWHGHKLSPDYKQLRGPLAPRRNDVDAKIKQRRKQATLYIEAARSVVTLFLLMTYFISLDRYLKIGKVSADHSCIVQVSHKWGSWGCNSISNHSVFVTLVREHCPSIPTNLVHTFVELSTNEYKSPCAHLRVKNRRTSERVHKWSALTFHPLTFCMDHALQNGQTWHTPISGPLSLHKSPGRQNIFTLGPHASPTWATGGGGPARTAVDNELTTRAASVIKRIG